MSSSFDLIYTRWLIIVELLLFFIFSRFTFLIFIQNLLNLGDRKIWYIVIFVMIVRKYLSSWNFVRKTTE